MAEEIGNVPSQGVRTDRRRELSRRLREGKRQRIALLFIAFFVLVIASAAVAIYVKVFVLPPRQLVVRVDNVRYTRGDMVKVLQAQQKQSELLGAGFRSGTEVFEALQLLVENEIIAQSAPKFSIAVSDEEVDAEIRELFSPVPPGALADPIQVEREFQERFRSYLNSIQLSKQEYREQRRKALLRERVRQFIGESVPTVAQQVRLHRIVMSPEDEVDVMLVKFKDTVSDTSDPEKLREAIKQVVREFSRDDPETVRKGGDLGWAPRGAFKDYDDAIFALEVGKLSEPTPDIDNQRQIIFFVISEKQEARELEPYTRDLLKTGALQEWVNNERESHDVYAVFNSDIYDWVLKQLRASASTTPTPQPNPLGF